MKNDFLILACILVTAFGLIAVPFPDGAVGVLLVIALSLFAIFVFRRFTEEKEFVTTIFFVGLALRMGFGLFVHVFELREFFGGDASTYDNNGAGLVEVWLGHKDATDFAFYVDPRTTVGWGMNYLTGFIYFLLGRNIFAAQSFCAVVGAATAPMVYFCANKIYNNIRVAKWSAVAVAIFPSFIIWSSQLLKDGLIIFLLVTTMTMVLQLQEKLNYAAVALLIFSLFGIMSLRFYIFYMVLVAVAGSFLIGVSSSASTIVRRTVMTVLLGVSLTYLGAARNASSDFQLFGSLERLQTSRLDLTRAGSGFGEDYDISTTEGAITLVPIGFVYLMFAPFPWEGVNFRQAITIPEVILWWAMMPLLISGLIYTIKNRLRGAFPIVIFSFLLTLAYSIFQGNVGTAYRQRTQIQVFLFILIGVGWTLARERRENKRTLGVATQRRLENRLRAGT